MLLVFEMLFIVVLGTILFMLYRNERIIARSVLPQADMEEYWEGPERRRHIRFRKKLVVHYRILKCSGSGSRCRTVDISEGGMKLLLNEKLNKGVVLDLRILIPASRHSANAEGQVAWTEEITEKDAYGRRLFYAGVKFSVINSPRGSDANPLISYIRSLEHRPHEQVT